MKACQTIAIALLALCAAHTPARADDFDRLDGRALADAPKSGAAKPHERLTLAELGQLPSVLAGTRSAFLVLTTDQDNLARLLVSPALRKPPGGVGEPIPVLLVERFATFEAPGATTRMARGQDLLLFDGFRLDLDSGQVVPEGQGGDVQFLTSAPEGPRIVATGSAKIYTFSESPLPPANAQAGPSPGRAILPGDFAGRYRLFANGQMAGTLDLKVSAEGAVSGQLRSDLNGSYYPVTGQVAADMPQRISFAVKFPRSRQEFEGYLWTEGKGAMAGTVTILDRPYGFFALREGGRYAPEGSEVGDLEEPGRRVVELNEKGQCTLDGKALDAQSLADALRAAQQNDANTWVLLRASPDVPYADVQKTIATIQAAGLRAPRLAPLVKSD